MVNASLNWASVTGLILLTWSIFTLPDSISKLVFILGKRADYELEPLVRRFLMGIRAAGRLFGCSATGLILFFQGWRLDPILQFSVFLLALGIIFESGSGILGERKRWAEKLLRDVQSKYSEQKIS